MAESGESIRDYDLLEVLGRGGMGVVWKARQHRLNRLVAVKLIKPDLDSAQVLARFEAERQTLALMDHPNIAHVLDAGATPDGWPFFVMELVSGRPITRYCDERELPLRARLELFCQVCLAIQHAHQKGIIHRDIKPSNVLVADQDGKPVPKVIDFGVAKAVAAPLQAQSAFTNPGAFVGTIEYMSPEQTAPHSLDIDTRSDIYSLGVMLYQLLTGTTPLTRVGDSPLPLDEQVRRIRDEEPPKPSLRLREQWEAASATAGPAKNSPSSIPDGTTADSVRAPAPGAIPRQMAALRGDVDWIVMKALEKDRNRRYESAAALAADIRRHLNDEPVVAGPPSTTYRLRKFVRKHRLAVTGTTAVIIGLTAATVISLMMTARAQRAEQEARKNLDRALFEEQGRRVVAGFYAENIIRPARPKALRRPDSEGMTRPIVASGVDVKLMDVLNAAEQRIPATFSTLPHLEAEIRAELGLAFQELGQYTNAVRQHERVLELRRRHSSTNTPALRAALNNLGTAYCQAGRVEEGILMGREALRLARSQEGSNFLDALTESSNLALACKDAGNLDEAVPILENVWQLRREHLGPDHPDSLLSLQNLAVTYDAIGRKDEALPLYEESYSRYRTNALFASDDPLALQATHDLGGIYSEMGQPQKAIPLFEEALAGMRRTLTESHHDTLSCLNDLGVACLRLRQYQAAASHLRQAYEGKRQLLGETNHSTLTSLDNLCVACVRGDDRSNAVYFLERAIAYKRAKAGPELTNFIQNLSVIHARTAAAWLDKKQFQEAESAARQAVKLREETMPGRSPLFEAQTLLGAALLGQNRLADAEPFLQQAFDGLRQRIDGRSTNSTPQLQLFQKAARYLSKVYEQTDRADRAAQIRLQIKPPVSTPPALQ